MVPVPLNPLFKPDDYRYLLADSDAQAVVVDLDLLGKVREALAAHGEPVELITVGGRAEGAHDFDELLAEHAGELDPANSHRDDLAFWLYSSGSTGRPKGVVHLQHDLPYTCQTYGSAVLGISEDDVCLSTTKLFHAYGLGNGLSFPYWAGATAVLLRGGPTPAAILDAVERHRPTLFFSVPTLYNAMLAAEAAAERDLSSVRLCISAAESLPAEIWRRWHDTFGLTILDGIGSTEMLHIFCSNAAERPAARLQRQARARLRPEAAGRGAGRHPGRARPATCTSAATARWPATGGSTRRPSRRCSATGSPPATATAGTTTASGGTRAGPTT